MNYLEYQEKIKAGLVLGDGARAYTIEKVTSENTYLRGAPDGQRQRTRNDNGSLRIIPTTIILDIMKAVQEGKIGLVDIFRNHRAKNNLPTLFSFLGLDYDPFILGYDSTFYKICEYLSSGRLVTQPKATSASDVEEEKKGLSLPKPFLLLAGISGTGKTRWVQERKHPEKDNCRLIPVRPDWHEPSDLLGYISRISGNAVFIPTSFLDFLITAWRDVWAAESSLYPSSEAVSDMVPHWLCLDEMNLAPVEQYFADYLSVLELREWKEGRYFCPPLLRFDTGDTEAIRTALGIETTDPMWTAFVAARGIPLPPNLVVVGTVNMDETTHGFSRKVLDRALTIEFDAVDFGIFGGTPNASRAETVPWTGLLAATSSEDVEIDPEARMAVIGMLESWNGILDGTPFRIAYRTINEGILIAASLAEKPIEERLDWISMTKLLPRLEGDEDKLGMDREGRETSFLDDVAADWANRLGSFWDGSRAKRKIDFMKSRLKRSGYTSFWP